MNHLERLQDLLPPPFATAPDSLFARILDVVALELEAFDEHLDRVRQSHWIRTAFALADVEKLADLMGIKRLPWETLPLFRERLLARVTAQLRGALGPGEIEEFAYDYLVRAERILGSSFVQGLQTVTLEQAYSPPPDRPRFRPLRLVENPPRERKSPTLLARGGLVPYLGRWTEVNRGLDDTVARFALAGLEGGRTAAPIVANLTTGDVIGYRGTLRFGQTLVFGAAGPGADDPRSAVATLDGRNAGPSAFSLGGFRPGVPFTEDQFDAAPRLPRMARGANEWAYLSAGYYDVKGLDHFAFAIADDRLREGAFDQTAFDESIFPAGPAARVEMAWTETEPASFEVHVPRHIVSEPGASSYEQVADGLRESIADLRAAGVRAEVVFEPFRETQAQAARGRTSWVRLDPEPGPSGRDRLEVGARFDDSPLGTSRFD